MAVFLNADGQKLYAGDRDVAAIAVEQLDTMLAPEAVVKVILLRKAAAGAIGASVGCETMVVPDVELITALNEQCMSCSGNGGCRVLEYARDRYDDGTL